jgi:hypothetical protein
MAFAGHDPLVVRLRKPLAKKYQEGRGSGVPPGYLWLFFDLSSDAWLAIHGACEFA